MTSYVVRPITEAERRPARALLSLTLHGTAASDEVWELVGRSWRADRKFGAFDGDAIVGITSSMGTHMLVPGGGRIPTAMVDGVGVRADHTRRGLFTRLMRVQLEDCAARGDVAAALHASETVIYGRAGYGAATRRVSVRVRAGRGTVRPDLPASGRMRLLDAEEAVSLVPGLYRSIAPHRPGMIDRPDHWWPADHDRLVGRDGHLVAVHSSASGTDDGYVVYKTEDARTDAEPERGATVRVRDLHAASPVVAAELWRYLLGMDLVAEVIAPALPLDDEVELMLADPRRCAVTGRQDDLWLRLVDVPAALAARAYGAGPPVLVDVVDPLLAANSGRYRISREGAERVPDSAGTAGLRLGVDVLAMLYLGDRAPSTLAELGRIEVGDPAAPAAADALFGTTRPPWCGTFF
ncbi:GNAT family N-acetyltransferase [Amycolatopsis antarctica]|uniref:GNAT family N-acetyltransferase n=1 Tax=Amycolatopsis antarctica TaxID=1854586 RepID=A0A263D646_9PSEU|nr:GNAT family N-acetyltransferase [Amycolatopsis antarctica]OZM72946.1 GNAT family N-acetyltransferase [Amycolatopsis antarctica]